jgi:hypothetical protein
MTTYGYKDNISSFEQNISELKSSQRKFEENLSVQKDDIKMLTMSKDSMMMRLNSVE